MKYNIQKAVDYILDPEKPTPLRAIKLFTFLVAIHENKSIARISAGRASNADNSLIISVRKETLRHARLLAGMKFLERIEADWLSKNPDKNAAPLKVMAKLPDYRLIYDKVIARHGGWYRIRYLKGLSNFNEQLSDQKKKAWDIARIIDFSARFPPDQNRRKYTGGRTMAMQFITSEDHQKYFQTKRGKTQIEQYWSDLKSTAPFLFLLYFRKHPFFLNFIRAREFPKRVTRKIEDIDSLYSFFHEYNALVDRLRPRGYSYSRLKLPIENAHDPVNFGSFRKSHKEEAVILEAISRHKA